MKEGGMVIPEIAESVGLDPKNFARIFKRETGMTPTEYKRKIESGADINDIYRRYRKKKGL